MDSPGLGTDGTIRTFTGRLFRPLDPAPGEIEIRDIAHALAHTCRFGGHTREAYSVAQHAVLVSHHAEQIDRYAGLWGLLHDASEAYLCDVPRPLKHHPALWVYRQAEAALQDVIYRQFGCLGPVPAAVAIADDDVLAIEFRDLMPAREGDGWAARAGAAPPIRPMTPREAEGEFLIRFVELYARRFR